MDSNGDWIRKTYCNDWTEKPGTSQQLKLKFIEFPDKPSAATKRFGYLIQVGGYTTYHIGVTLESQQKSFIKCLVPVPVLNAATFFKFHRNLEKECATRGIWIPSWYTVEADVKDPRGFTVAD